MLQRQIPLTLRAPDSQQVSTSNDHTDSSSRSPYDESARLLHSESRRTSASTTTRKRVGRIYSTSTVTSDLTYADELRTPRVSVSNQGRLADSIYSVASTASDIFPGMADTSKDLPAPPDEPKQGELGLGLGMESSRRLSLNQYAVVEDAGENDDTFIQPAASRFSAYSASTFSGADSPTEQSRDSLSLAETAYSNAFRNSVNSLASSLDLAPQTTTKGMTEDEKKKVKRAKIIEELVQTEEDYARDMALLRDVWLARARGKEMGEIMALLESYTWGASRPLSTSSSISNLVNNAEAPGIRLVERKSSAPQMQRNASQTSFRSFKGLVNSVGKNNQEKLPSVPTRDHGGRAASYSGAPRQRSLSNVQPLPPGAALYAPMRQVDVEVIFGNIEAVAAFSSQFAIILREEQSSEENGKGEARIGQAFLTMVSSGVKPPHAENTNTSSSQLHRLSTVYSAYCAHFGDAIQRWESISDSLLSYSQDCKDLCFGHTNAWDLPSLLIKPVQRCLKYPLFIQSLLDCTSDEHSDKSSLAESNVAILKVAEGINEMKRRHEIVTKLIKRKARPGLYGNTRRGSEKGQQPVKAPSSGSFTASLSRRFKRSSRIGLPDTSATVSVPEPDEDFEALLVLLESKHHRIQSFILDSKSWSKSVRTAMVSLLHVSLAWQNLSSLSEHDDTQEGSQSARTIGHFAASVVRPAVEDQWRDMDQEIRKVLVPKASQLLELFSSPRSAIASEYLCKTIIGMIANEPL